MQLAHLFDRLRGAASDEWHAYVAHPFVAGIIDIVGIVIYMNVAIHVLP